MQASALCSGSPAANGGGGRVQACRETPTVTALRTGPGLFTLTCCALCRVHAGSPGPGLADWALRNQLLSRRTNGYLYFDRESNSSLHQRASQLPLAEVAGTRACGRLPHQPPLEAAVGGGGAAGQVAWGLHWGARSCGVSGPER